MTKWVIIEGETSSRFCFILSPWCTKVWLCNIFNVLNHHIFSKNYKAHFVTLKTIFKMRESQEGPMRILFIELLENIYHAEAWWGPVVSKWDLGLVPWIRLPTFCPSLILILSQTCHLAPNCSGLILTNSLQLSNPDISCLIEIESYFTQFIVKPLLKPFLRTEFALALL